MKIRLLLILFSLISTFQLSAQKKTDSIASKTELIKKELNTDNIFILVKEAL